MPRSIKLMMAVLGFAAVHQVANAQCMARHAYSGQVVQARERNGPLNFWAYASFDPDGWPAITYSPAFYQLTPLMQEFTRRHECAHLAVPTSDEFMANCVALRSRMWSRPEIDHIAATHHAIGVQGPQYGGSGASFWQITLDYCPEFR